VSLAIDYACANRDSHRPMETVPEEKATLQSVEGDECPTALRSRPEFGEIIGKSRALGLVLSDIEMVGPTDSCVLLLEQRGTGKELMERAIQRMSPRADRTFLSINCAAIPRELLENELFGYEPCPSNGDMSPKIGRLEEANHSTLFLEEIADLPLEAQFKLLRVLQDGEFARI